MFVDNYGSVASGARYGYNLLEADNLDSENPWSVLKADDYFLTANTKHGGIVSLTKPSTTRFARLMPSFRQRRPEGRGCDGG